MHNIVFPHDRINIEINYFGPVGDNAFAFFGPGYFPSKYLCEAVKGSKDHCYKEAELRSHVRGPVAGRKVSLESRPEFYQNFIPFTPGLDDRQVWGGVEIGPDGNVNHAVCYINAVFDQPLQLGLLAECGLRLTGIFGTLPGSFTSALVAPLSEGEIRSRTRLAALDRSLLQYLYSDDMYSGIGRDEAEVAWEKFCRQDTERVK